LKQKDKHLKNKPHNNIATIPIQNVSLPPLA